MDGLDFKEFGIIGVMFGFLFYVLKMVFDLVKSKQNQPEEEKESASKNDSRDKIMATYEIVRDVQERQKNRDKAFFEMKGEVEDICEIITAKISGTPIVYQPQMDIAVKDLSRLMTELNKSNDELIKVRHSDHKRLGVIESSLQVFKTLYAK